MKEFYELKEKFIKIKNIGFIKSLRKGSTGIGYTFETLLGKKEDQETTPDFKGIEIKCKAKYTKYDLGLFTYNPKRDDILATQYLFQKYSYHLNDNINMYRLFSRKIYADYKYELNNYSFKLKVNYSLKKIYIESYYKDQFCENVCYWNFNDLEERLMTKLKKLAIVYGYVYKIFDQTFYKYNSISFYKFKNFNKFLYLIEKGDIYIVVHLREDVNKLGDYIIKNNGFSFRIKNNCVEKLFDRINI